MAGEAFNITNDEAITYEDLAIAVQRYHGPGLYRIPAPTLLLLGLARVVEALQWLFANKTAWLGADLNITTPACFTTAGLSFAISGAKARRLLNYKPLWNVDEAVQQSLADFAEQQSAKQKTE